MDDKERKYQFQDLFVDCRKREEELRQRLEIIEQAAKDGQAEYGDPDSDTRATLRFIELQARKALEGQGE